MVVLKFFVFVNCSYGSKKKMQQEKCKSKNLYYFLPSHLSPQSYFLTPLLYIHLSVCMSRRCMLFSSSPLSHKRYWCIENFLGFLPPLPSLFPFLHSLTFLPFLPFPSFLPFLPSSPFPPFLLPLFQHQSIPFYSNLFNWLSVNSALNTICCLLLLQ